MVLSLVVKTAVVKVAMMVVVREQTTESLKEELKVAMKGKETVEMTGDEKGQLLVDLMVEQLGLNLA